VMLPIELIPVRTVLVALSGEMVALGLVLLLSMVGGSLGPGALALPIASGSGQPEHGGVMRRANA
ncbi:MAG TPA: hypothetical protein VL176_11240, partial [Steroidobacteraceae bacterium]|nr:hypothetical protein [Steroidobacteraceae bacterium]